MPIWHQFKTRKHSYVLPFAFTEYGVAMLSSVLNSERAIKINIIIIARLYAVETKQLTRQVRRNIERFPDDFMFQLTKEEASIWRSQIVISKNWGRRRYLPYAFTQEGVSMLSSILNSEQAIMVNIQIMRAFVSLRRIALTYTGLKRKIDNMEKKYDSQFSVVFEVIRKLLEPPPEKPKPRIGFH